MFIYVDTADNLIVLLFPNYNCIIIMMPNLYSITYNKLTTVNYNFHRLFDKINILECYE